MKARIIRIGNSRGIRLPKVLLEHAHLGEDVQIEAEPNQITIRSSHSPRQGWADAFQSGADDLPVDESAPTSFDQTEWEW
jgi:antitoxin MazE